MAKRTHKEIRDEILKVLCDGKLRSYGWLERKIDTNWLTIRNHCEELREYKLININDDLVSLSKEGMIFIKKIK